MLQCLQMATLDLRIGWRSAERICFVATRAHVISELQLDCLHVALDATSPLDVKNEAQVLVVSHLFRHAGKKHIWKDIKTAVPVVEIVAD